MTVFSILRVSVLFYIVGILAFSLWQSKDEAIWFAIGGALALMNIFFAVWAVRYGLKSPGRKASFLILLFFKSMTFLMVIAATLTLLKPLVLPFTLGLAIVIVGAVGAGLWQSRQSKQKKMLTT